MRYDRHTDYRGAFFCGPRRRRCGSLSFLFSLSSATIKMMGVTGSESQSLLIRAALSLTSPLGHYAHYNGSRRQRAPAYIILAVLESVWSLGE